MELINSMLQFQGTNFDGIGCCGVMLMFMISMAVIAYSRGRDG